MTIRKLKAVEPKSAKPAKPKVLIFGRPGVRKTWVSIDFPGVYYIDTEGGANRPAYTDKLKAAGGVYFGPEEGSLDFEAIIAEVQTLATVEHGYKTLVIDSVTKIFNLEIQREAERLKLANKKNEYGLDRKPAVAFMRRLVSWLQRLDMNVILVGHAKDEYLDDVKIGDTFDAWDKLEYELDLCLNIVKVGPSHFMKVRKSRLEGFEGGATMPWSYESFADAHGREAIEQASTHIVLTTQDELAELNRLLILTDMSPTWMEKVLKKAGVDHAKDLESEKVGKLIDYIKNVYIPKMPIQQ